MSTEVRHLAYLAAHLASAHTPTPIPLMPLFDRIECLSGSREILVVDGVCYECRAPYTSLGNPSVSVKKIAAAEAPPKYVALSEVMRARRICAMASTTLFGFKCVLMIDTATLDPVLCVYRATPMKATFDLELLLEIPLLADIDLRVNCPAFNEPSKTEGHILPFEDGSHRVVLSPWMKGRRIGGNATVWQFHLDDGAPLTGLRCTFLQAINTMSPSSLCLLPSSRPASDDGDTELTRLLLNDYESRHLTLASFHHGNSKPAQFKQIETLIFDSRNHYKERLPSRCKYDVSGVTTDPTRTFMILVGEYGFEVHRRSRHHQGSDVDALNSSPSTDSERCKKTYVLFKRPPNTGFCDPLRVLFLPSTGAIVLGTSDKTSVKVYAGFVNYRECLRDPDIPIELSAEVVADLPASFHNHLLCVV